MENNMTIPEERIRIFGNLFLISTRMETIGNEYLGDITTKQWFFLATLFTFFTEPPTLSELSELMGSSRQNVKQIALKLETKGYIEIHKDAQDARILRIVPTEKSVEYGAEFEAKGKRFLDILFKDFGKAELTELTRLTDKLLGTITEMQDTKNYMEEDYHENNYHL